MRPLAYLLVAPLLLLGACKRTDAPAAGSTNTGSSSTGPSITGASGSGTAMVPAAASATPAAADSPEGVSRRVLAALDHGDLAALDDLYMSRDEVRGMADCAKDQVAMRDANVAAIKAWIAAKPAATKLTFLKWVEQNPIKVAKGQQAAGCTTRADLEIVNGTLVYSEASAALAGAGAESKTRAVSTVKTARGWRVSQIDDTK